MTDPASEPTCSTGMTRCLYFTANAVAREITRLADDAFGAIGMCPSGALLLSMVVERPGIAPSEAAEQLHLAPSSITRFADGLERKGWVERRQAGRRMNLFPTKFGMKMMPSVRDAWSVLHQRYTDKVGETRARDLAMELAKVATDLDRE